MNIKIKANINKGLYCKDNIKLPFNKEIKALVNPHPGHGIPNISLKGQMEKLSKKENNT